MEVEYELTREDYWELNQAFMRRQFPFTKLWKPISWLLVLTFALMLLISALLTLLEGSLDWVSRVFEPPLGSVLLLLIAALLVSLLLLAATRRWVKRLPRKDGALLGRHRLRLSDQGLDVETKHVRGTVAWTGIAEVSESPEHVFIWLERAVAYIVPKRAFADVETARRFVEQARAYLASAPRN